MALTDTAIRQAKPQAKPYKLYDEGGLFAIVTPAGGKWWRLKYRANGKEQLLSLGTYPDVGLKEARAKRDNARKLLAGGGDPGVERKRKAAAEALAKAETFGALANEFIEKREREGLSGATLVKARWFASLLQAGIGKRPISEIEPFEILSVLKDIRTRPSVFSVNG